MVESSQSFPHIPLRLTTEGRAASLPGALIRNPITVANLGNRQEHGNKLKVSIETLIFDWQDTQEKREEKNKSKVLYPISLILKIDPSYFDADRLRTFGIEVIAELEDGYILGISLDIELLQKEKLYDSFFPLFQLETP
ncbi:MAG: hypothetical protein V7L05_10495 [Nostoc sp.]|uniref:hypothetical protein n=1 Tax=Nostoc sp. TaxID=1180 RepID=UPI002FF6B4A6